MSIGTTPAIPVAAKTPWQTIESAMLKLGMVAALLVGQHYYDRFEYGSLRPPAPVVNTVVPPAPVPVAKVVPGHVFSTYVYDEPSKTPAMAAIADSFTIHPALTALDSDWRVLTLSQGEYAASGLKPYVDKVGTPALIVQDKSGTVVEPIKAPTTEADVIATIKQIRGAK